MKNYYDWIYYNKKNFFREIPTFQGSFRDAVWPMIVLGQFFGALPVSNVRSYRVSELQFQWTSVRTLYSLFIIVSLSAYSTVLIWKTLSVENDLFSHIGISYYDFSFVTQLNFYTAFFLEFLSFFVIITCEYIALFVLAMKWPHLMGEWENTLLELPTFGDENQKSNFVLKIRLVIFVFLFLAISNCLISKH